VIAGEIIKSRGPGECRLCESNEGKCHKVAEDDSRYNNPDSELECACPASRTGDNCETVRGSYH